jgi:hypothetical protein
MPPDPGEQWALDAHAHRPAGARRGNDSLSPGSQVPPRARNPPLPPPVSGKRHPGCAPQGILLALFVGPLRPLPDGEGLEAVIALIFHPHRQRRHWIEAVGKQLPGAVNERLAGAGDDDLARAFQPGGEPAGSIGGNNQPDSLRVSHWPPPSWPPSLSHHFFAVGQSPSCRSELAGQDAVRGPPAHALPDVQLSRGI